MRGVGGPLLTIGDLLSDLAVGGGDGPLAAGGDASVPSSPSAEQRAGEADPSDLSRLFEAADKLVSSANMDAEQLMEKVKVLEGVLERGDRAVEQIVESLQRSGLAKDHRSSQSKSASK